MRYNTRSGRSLSAGQAAKPRESAANPDVFTINTRTITNRQMTFIGNPSHCGDGTLHAYLFCLSRTLSFDDVLEFSTARQEKLDVKAKVFHA